MSTPADPGIGGVFDAAVAGFAAWTPELWDPLGADTADAAGLRPGERVLDACCGNGASAIPAARAVGPDGRVDAVDLSAGLLAAGRARAGDLPALRFHRADLTGWTGSGYDALLCAFGVFFLPDPEGDTRALVRRLRPGGRAAVTAWASGSVDPLIGPFLAAVARVRTMPPPGPMQRTAGRIGDPDRFAAWLGEAGLAGVGVHTVRRDVPLTPGRCWDLVTGSATAGLLAGLDAEAVGRIREEYHRAVAGLDVFRVAAHVGTGVTAHDPA